MQAAFCHASLGTKIHINYADTVILINDLRDEFNFEEDYANNVIGPIIKPLTKDEMEKDSSLNLMVYLTNNVGSGVAFGQPCGSLESRFSINQCGSTDDVYGMLTCVAVCIISFSHWKTQILHLQDLTGCLILKCAIVNGSEAWKDK